MNTESATYSQYDKLGKVNHIELDAFHNVINQCLLLIDNLWYLDFWK